MGTLCSSVNLSRGDPAASVDQPQVEPGHQPDLKKKLSLFNELHNKMTGGGFFLSH